MMVRVSECILISGPNTLSKYMNTVIPYPAWAFMGAVMAYLAKLYFTDLLHKKQSYINAGTF
jgi:hypothetical protein